MSSEEAVHCACGTEKKSYQVICNDCAAKESYTTRNVKWKKFFSEIKQFNQHYKLIYSSMYPEEVIGVLRENPFDETYVKIYRQIMYGITHSNGSSTLNKYALRISTNSRKCEAARLKKDFDAKDIAKTLHKKCDDMLAKMSDDITAEYNRAREKGEKIKNIKNEFRNIKNYKDNDSKFVSFKNTRITLSEEKKMLENGILEITPYNTININTVTRKFSLRVW